MNKSLLITGGMGYLGGRISRALSQGDYKVYCGSRKDLNPPSWLPDVSMVHMDWSSIDALTETCKGMDCVVHLAAMNEIDAENNAICALEANGAGSLRLLEASKRAGVKRFIYFSTAHVYGAQLQGTINELSLPRPNHPYAISHKAAEDFVLAAHDRGEIEGVVIRLSNAFGAPAVAKVDRWSLLVNDLCRQAVINGVLRLKTSGMQLRNFIKLNDVTRAVDHFIRLNKFQLQDGLFNVGSSYSRSVLDMANLVAGRWEYMTGKSISIQRLHDVGSVLNHNLNYCCKKLEATGFLTSTDFCDEIDDTLAMCIQEFESH